MKNPPFKSNKIFKKIQFLKIIIKNEFACTKKILHERYASFNIPNAELSDLGEKLSKPKLQRSQSRKISLQNIGEKMNKM